MDTLGFEWRDASNTVVGTSAQVDVQLALGGPHTFTLTVDDGKGGTDTAQVSITVQDLASPVLSVPNPEVEVVPTTPTGTVIDVIAASGATATDLCDPSPVLTHDHPGEFPIGVVTDVHITATDATGNSVSQRFTVRVLTTEESVQQLTDAVASVNVPQGVSNPLINSLDTASAKLGDSNPNNDTAACAALNAFITQVRNRRGKPNGIPPADADALIAAAEVIAAAAGC